MDNYRTIEQKLKARKPFKGNSMSASLEKHEGEIWLTVYSYRTPIARHAMGSWKYQFDSKKYSATTSRHQNLVRRAWGIA
jgi:hypothetical protein